MKNRLLISLFLGLLLLLGFVSAASTDTHVGVPVTHSVWQIAEESMSFVPTNNMTPAQINLEVVSRTKRICQDNSLAVPEWSFRGGMDARRIPKGFEVQVPQEFLPTQATAPAVSEPVSTPQRTLVPAPTQTATAPSKNIWRQPWMWIVMALLLIVMVIAFLTWFTDRRNTIPIQTLASTRRDDDTIPVPDPLPVNPTEKQVHQYMDKTRDLCRVTLRPPAGQNITYLVSREPGSRKLNIWRPDEYGRSERVPWKGRARLFPKNTPTTSTPKSSIHVS